MQEEVRIGLMLGAHDNIVQMKEFVENASKCARAPPASPPFPSGGPRPGCGVAARPPLDDARPAGTALSWKSFLEVCPNPSGDPTTPTHC